MSVPDVARYRDGLPGRCPALGGPARNDRDWLEQLPSGGYAPGRSDPRYWPRGHRQVTARVTRADVTEVRRRGVSPAVPAARRALRLPEEAVVTMRGEWLAITLGGVREEHCLPEAACGRIAAGDEFTITTAEDWQAAASEEES